ncbi:hypothetical protein SAMN05216327_102129 [Dyadobacter sp. SG02]|nr:hypothetical protein SAMN05216327_102129 [Dyadobacter sp. SG02]
MACFGYNSLVSPAYKAIDVRTTLKQHSISFWPDQIIPIRKDQRINQIHNIVFPTTIGLNQHR